MMRRAPYITVSFTRPDGTAYGLPLSLASTDDSTWYFHCAPVGEKLDCIALHPEVCLSAVTKCRPTVGPRDGDFTLQYESAIAFGLAELVTDPEEKIKGLRAISERFLPQHMEPLLKKAQVMPAVDQLEFHPGYTQEAAVAYCKEKGILVQAWSPLGRARVLKDPMILEMAEQYGVSAAKLCLRYVYQRGVQPLPKASSYERMLENQDYLSFEISKEDMYRISTMPQTGWSGEHPDRERVSLG